MKRVSMYQVLPLAFLIVALLPGAVGTATAAERTVWQIGKFDQSSQEFNHAADIADRGHNPTFTVGKSNSGKDWPSYQPGSENKSMGGRPHPYTILFDLPDHPAGLYRLKVSVILTRSRIPSLQVEINGQTGMFFFNRRP